jgi:hypothetical protein
VPLLVLLTFFEPTLLMALSPAAFNVTCCMLLMPLL